MEPKPMRTTIELISPERADQLLARNEGNRQLRPQRVAFFAGIINRDEWRLTSQGISISPTGRLLNGQHRLAAVVASGRTVPIQITYDEPEENFALLDTDMLLRRAGDFLGCESKIAEVSKLIAELAYPAHVRTVECLRKVHTVFGPAARKVFSACPTTKRAVSAAAVRTAAAIRITRGEESYVLPLWEKIGRLDMNDLPPVAQSFLRQAFDTARVTSRNRLDFLCRA